MSRPSRVVVDLDAVMANVEHLRRTVAPSRVCAVVKADAYGHGDVPVAEAAVAAGADLLAVALVEEAARLRDAGIDAPILLLYEPPIGDAAAVVDLDLVPSVHRREFVEALAGSGIGVQLAIDTGMHRSGADPADAPALAEAILGAGLTLAGTWTHLAVAESDPAFTQTQLEVFERVLDDLRALGIDPGVRHAANSAGALHQPASRLDMVRAGIAVYGLPPDPTRPDPALRPAMSVVSEVSMTRRLPAGARPSYGRLRPLPAEGTVATVPVGYADGYPRGLGLNGAVLIGGRRCPLAGTVTMDQIVVDVDAHPVVVGDEVVLLGARGDEAITADDWAAALDTISYEVVSRVGARLPRCYVGGPGAR